jgi:hypothetical protein
MSKITKVLCGAVLGVVMLLGATFSANAATPAPAAGMNAAAVATVGGQYYYHHRRWYWRHHRRYYWR